MGNYTFNNMINDLQFGREIEFSFQNYTYGIINNKGYWYFCCNEKNPSIKLSKFDDKEDLIAKISDKNLIGIDLKDIFDTNKYEEDSLCIF